jgi:hypothetical protein
MKSMPADYSHYDIPELEETEFALSVSPCPRIEDSNDLGDIGDSYSIDSIVANALFREFDWK